jgi:hypothetical protein
MDTQEFLKVRRHLAFSLRLSEAFGRVANFMRAREIFLCVAAGSIIMLTIFFPYTSILSLCLTGLLFAIIHWGRWMGGFPVVNDACREFINFVRPSYIIFWVILIAWMAFGGVTSLE